MFPLDPNYVSYTVIPYSKPCQIEMEGGAIWVTVKSMYAIGGFVASVHVHSIGEWGQIFPVLLLTYYMNDFME